MSRAGAISREFTPKKGLHISFLPILHFSISVATCFPSLFSHLLSSVLSFYSHSLRLRFSHCATTQARKRRLCYSCSTKAGNINTHFFPIDRCGISIFSSAHNISVSAGYNTVLLITIRPNNNIMESVKHTHTHLGTRTIRH